MSETITKSVTFTILNLVTLEGKSQVTLEGKVTKKRAETLAFKEHHALLESVAYESHTYTLDKETARKYAFDSKQNQDDIRISRPCGLVSVVMLKECAEGGEALASNGECVSTTIAIDGSKTILGYYGAARALARKNGFDCVPFGPVAKNGANMYISRAKFYELATLETVRQITEQEATQAEEEEAEE